MSWYEKLGFTPEEEKAIRESLADDEYADIDPSKRVLRPEQRKASGKNPGNERSV